MFQLWCGNCSKDHLVTIKQEKKGMLDNLEVSTQLNMCAFYLFDTLFASIFCSSADYALFWCYLHNNLASTPTNVYAETAPSNGAFWAEFSKHH